MTEPDEWLMQQVAKGSSQNLDALIRRYAHPILTFATRLLGSTHRGEEAFQEIFLAVWSRRQTYSYPRFFRPWLFRIAHNKCRELSRRRDFLAFRYDADPDPETLNPARTTTSFPAPAEAAIATETSTLIEAAITTLPGQLRAHPHHASLERSLLRRNRGSPRPARKHRPLQHALRPREPPPLPRTAPSDNASPK